MKYFWIVAIFLTTACGKYDAPTGNATVGQQRQVSTSRALGTSEQTSLSNICNALSVKASRLPQSTNAPFSFNSSQTDCIGTMISSGIVATTIQTDGANYFFKTSTGMNFIFPDVETPTHGVFTQICSSIGNIQDVTTLSNGDAQFVTLSGECPSVGGETCVLIETGSPVSGVTGTFRIHTKEWIRLNTTATSSRYGFFTYRKKVSQAFCSDTEAVTYQTTLN